MRGHSGGQWLSAARRCPARRRKEARPSELVSAAHDVFVEKGFAAARLEDVANRAGVTKGTVYLYFSSKEALFKEVVKTGLAPAVAALEALAAEAGRPPPEQLRRSLAVWRRVMAEARLGSLLKLLAAESGNFPEVAQWFREQVVGPARKMMTGIVAAGIANGDFRPVKAELAADVFASPLCFCALSDLWGDQPAPDLFLGAAFDMMVQGLGRATSVCVVADNTSCGGP